MKSFAALRALLVFVFLCVSAQASVTITATLCSEARATVTLERQSKTGATVSTYTSSYTNGDFSAALENGSDGSRYKVTIDCASGTDSTQYWLIPDVAGPLVSSKVSVAESVSLAAGWYWDTVDEEWASLSAGISSEAGDGDVSGPASSVDNEIALFSGAGGKTLKRASTTGILKGTSGVIGAAVAGTDYVTPAGNVATADALSANPAACGAGDFVTDIAADGTLTCDTPNGSGDLTEVQAGSGISVTSGTGPIPVIAVDESVVPKLGTANTFSGTQTFNGGVDFSGATVAAGDGIAEYKSINLPAPVVGDSGDYQFYFGRAVEILSVSCAVKAATSVTINLEERAVATPFSAGTAVLTSNLVCDTNTETSTTFSNSGIAADVPVALTISAVSGTPGILSVNIKYR